MRVVIARVVVACALMLCLAGCDPAGPAQPRSADVDVQLSADGTAEITLILPADRNDLSPLDLGGQVGEALFPAADERRVRLDDQGGVGYPLVLVRIAPAYTPGSHPQLTFDMGAAVAVLSEKGLTSVQVSVDAPYVPAKAHWSVPPDDQYKGWWSWSSLGAGRPAPSGVVSLDPRPSRAVLVLLLLAVTLVAVVAGFLAARASRRWAGALAGALAVVTSVLTIPLAAAAQGDNLGVAGYLSGTTLHVVTLLPLAGLLGLPLGIAVGVVALSRGPVGVLSAGSAAPGWYADPWRQGGLRFWDGRTWTPHLQPYADST